jgi:hypothetical protein
LEATVHLGFLTIVQEGGGFSGGYLVTNQWGRPLEFRLTSAVQPNRVQQILYGPTLRPYLCADLLGKTLVDKTGTPAHAVFTDCADALDLRWRVDVPVAHLAPVETAKAGADGTAGLRCASAALVWHAQFPQDAAALRTLLPALDTMDLAEPFTRVREALAEARKLGATGRAA